MAAFMRKNTIQVQFQQNATRPSAMEVHNFIENKLQLNEDQIDTIQLVAQDRFIYIKVTSVTIMQRILNQYTNEEIAFTYGNGEITKVSVDIAIGNLITVRVFDLPPEVPDEILKAKLQLYGTVHDIRKEKWSQQYNLKVYNGVRAAKMNIKTNIPNSMSVVGYRISVTYAGQPKSCFICGKADHIKDNCPSRSFRLTKKSSTELHVGDDTFVNLQELTSSNNEDTADKEKDNLMERKKETAMAEKALPIQELENALHQENDKDQTEQRNPPSVQDTEKEKMKTNEKQTNDPENKYSVMSQENEPRDPKMRKIERDKTIAAWNAPMQCDESSNIATTNTELNARSDKMEVGIEAERSTRKDDDPIHGGAATVTENNNVTQPRKAKFSPRDPRIKPVEIQTNTTDNSTDPDMKKKGTTRFTPY